MASDRMHLRDPLERPVPHNNVNPLTSLGTGSFGSPSKLAFANQQILANVEEMELTVAMRECRKDRQVRRGTHSH